LYCIPLISGSRAAVTTLAAVLVAVALGSCGGSDDGGSLTVYSGREAEYVKPLLERYEKREGVDLEVRYGETAELASTIREEGDNSPADVFFAQDAGGLGAVQKEGLLARLPVDVLERVDERYRSKTGHWVGTSARARIVGYDRRKLDEDDLPDSVLGFTDKRWKGRIGWAPTNASFQAFVTALRLIEGEDGAKRWLEGIVANEPEAFDDNRAIRDAIASGEIDVGFLNHYYVAQAYAQRGRDYPVGIYYPPAGDPGSLVNVAGVGVLASSGKHEQALDLVRFLLSAEAQRHFAKVLKEYPIAAGIKADRSLLPLRRIPQPDVDLSRLGDLEHTLELLEQTGAI
jgi:iron(III) transport system substrate-binding protein